MQSVWTIISGLCLLAAAYFLWRWQIDRAFVTGTIGLLAWFMNLRSRFHRANLERERASNQDEDEDYGEEDEV